MKHIIKDVTTIASPAIIVHGVNCQRIMRSGVAKAICEKWPEVIESYLQFPEDEMFLGKVDVIEVDERLFVLNCWTQDSYGYDNAIYASVLAIELCLESTIHFAIKNGIRNIYSPRIGCGLGGLNWENDVEPIFNAVEKKYQNIQITICNLN
ncbi:MAG: macro domain-containing protein [Coxiellaceae bacterium]|nr:macro domain-containing protein [Coxiellaceae bacterium]